MEIELVNIGVKLEINYTPPEKETWGFAGGTPPNDAEFEILGGEDTGTGGPLGIKLLNHIEEGFLDEIWKQINEELTLKS